jgi:hypothetical protein
MRLPPTSLFLAFACGHPPENDSSCNDTFFADADGDGYGDADSVTTACSTPPGYARSSDDCDDEDDAIHPGVDEICNGIDEDCDGAIDNRPIDPATWYADADHDGFGSAVTLLSCTQPDGHVPVTGDCADDDAEVNPDADELCNDIDDDCDELTDSLDPSLVQGATYYVDADGDAYGDPATGFHSCEPLTDLVLDGSDCDDANALAHPLADEVCDYADNDCDGLTDIADDGVLDPQAFYADADGDGFGNDEDTVVECFAPTGYVASGGDCDDADASIVASPDYFTDADGDGYGTGAAFQTCSPTTDLAFLGGDCKPGDPEVNPGAAEVCDEIDNNCDDLVDGDDPLVAAPIWYADDDGDAYGDPTDSVAACDAIDGYVLDGTDCHDAEAAIHPGASEYCDGIDNDCDATVDGAVVYVDWYADDDGDGYGDPGDVKNDCSHPSGYVADASDCDDSSATIHPDAQEICGTGIDEDCDLAVDNCSLSSGDADVFVEGPDSTEFATAGFGTGIAALDLNADGVSDVVVSNWGWNNTGRVYVGYGPVSAGAVADDMVTLSSDVSDGMFGYAVGGGDANGDEVDDLLVGATQGATLADAYLFLGPVTVDDARAAADVVLEGSLSPATSAGSKVGVVPDFDGDGAADIVVGAPDAERSTGEVYVVSGPVSGTLDVDADATYIYEGLARNDRLGWEYENVGDATGDGVNEVAFSAILDGTGTVYVLEGGGVPGTYVVDIAASGSLVGPEAISSFGYALSSADADDDGTMDLFVGAPGADGASTLNAGAVYRFLGPFSGVTAAVDADATWIADADIIVSGFGYELAAGDIDGDKHADVVMGASNYSTTPDGAVWLQLGAVSGTIEARTLATILGRSNDVLGVTIALVPDWTGDDGQEVALGAFGYRNASDEEVGALYLFESERFHP